MSSSLFTYTATAGGKPLALSKYSGYVTLVVNTASMCAFTQTNISLLNTLQNDYGPRKFTVLAFPSSQFANQEPLNDAQIQSWVRENGIQFPVFDKTAVKGKDVDPLFAMLQEALGAPRWNFSKYLCDRQGTPRRRFDAAAPEADLRAAIQLLL